MNILILSCGTRCLLVDYFMNRSNGFDKVIVTDCSSNSPALYRADKYYLVPPMVEKSYLPTIFDICDNECINAVLPLHEEELLLIAQNKELFIDRGVFPIISDYDVVSLCRDKYAFFTELKKRNISTVPTYLIQDKALLIEQYDFPLFLKPRFGAGSESSYKINDIRIIDDIIYNASTEFVLQPYINGTEFGVTAYVDFISGEVTDLFILKKIRMRAGETEKSESVLNDEIASLVLLFLDKTSLVGPIDIDVLEKDGKYYILEVNPRFGGSYPHAYECGINYIRNIANNISGKHNSNEIIKYEEGMVAFRYMTISVMNRKDMPYEK